MTVVVGVDGARGGGWVAVRLHDRRLDQVEEHRDFDGVIKANEDAAVLGVDIPIGHEDPAGRAGHGHRAADEAARAMLGDRRDSVFWVPPPVVLAQRDHAGAVRAARRLGVPAPSIQLWALKPRIEEVAGYAAQDPRILEIHPEVCFEALRRDIRSTVALDHGKRTWNGIHARLALLHAARLRPARSLGGVGKAGPDDVLDATVAAWSAARIAAKEHATLPARPPKDPRTGRAVAIHY